jgi:hypothetical protein
LEGGGSRVTTALRALTNGIFGAMEILQKSVSSNPAGEGGGLMRSRLPLVAV